MNNKEFLDIFMTCNETKSSKDISLDKMESANIDLSKSYKILKMFEEKEIDDKEGFNDSLWIILGHIANICHGHYYNGDYNDIVKEILNRFIIMYPKGAPRRMSNLVFDFFISNLNKPYRLNLRDFKRCFVSMDRNYNGHILDSVNNGGNDIYIFLDNEIKCSVCFIKDGKFKYKPYKKCNYKDNIDFMLYEDYDFLFLPYVVDTSIRNILKKDFHRKNISNREYFRLMLTLDAISIKIDQGTRLTIWEEVDKVLDCELDLKSCLDLLFKERKGQDTELGDKFMLLQSVISGTKGLEESIRKKTMERLILEGLKSRNNS